MKTSSLTQKNLKRLLKYNPDTGIFRWIRGRGNQICGGYIAGGVHPDGYIQIKINGVMHLAHRLAWLYMMGDINDSLVIDHIDMVKANNKWENLRIGTHSLNMRNFPLRKDNTSGVTGVSWHKTKKRWVVRINNNNHKRVIVGTFVDKNKAIQARIDAENKYKGGYNKSVMPSENGLVWG